MLKQPFFVPESLIVQGMDISGVITALAGAALVQVLALSPSFLGGCLHRLEFFFDNMKPFIIFLMLNSVQRIQVF